jgi:competence protein ComEA
VNQSGAGAPKSTRPAGLGVPQSGRSDRPSARLDAAPHGDDVVLHWTARDRWFFAVLALVILVLMAIQFARLAGWGLKPLEILRPENRKYEFQLDVNSASWVEWMQLEGIGEATARKIVADREKNGPFRSVDDVARVSGIGPATLEKIRPWLRWELPAGGR